MKTEQKWAAIGLAIGMLCPLVLLAQRLGESENTWGKTAANGLAVATPALCAAGAFLAGRRVTRSKERFAQQVDSDRKQWFMLDDFIGSLDRGDMTAQVSRDFEDRKIAALLEGYKAKLLAEKEEEELRTWETRGLASFGELLRASTDLSHLADDVVRFLVKYVDGNQGSIFFLQEQPDDEPVLTLAACYAYDRKKHMTKTVALGEGLVGQCYYEKETIVLHQVPQDYIRITSGLGSGAPGFIAIIPLKTNDHINGILEIASFKKLSANTVKFLEKAAEAFASVIQSMKTNDHVRTLLEASQRQTEELRSQEEEMRQNMEEIQAIQEQMSRQLERNTAIRHELEAREKVLGLTTILSESDLFGTITFVNEKFCEISQYSREELIGKAHNLIRHPDMPKEIFRQMWTTIKAGEAFNGIVKNRKKDGSHYWVDSTIVPVIEDGKIVKYIGARYHIKDDDVAEKLFFRQMRRMGLIDLVR
jgi:PAS domain S-box-containing protein